MNTKRVAIVSLMLVAAGCATSPYPNATPRPEFSQRAAPRPGQDEIALLAGIEGTLAIDHDDWCLGLITKRGDEEFFVTIVWPSNAELAWASGRWTVENTETGKVIEVGMSLSGSGGFNGDLDVSSLRKYNRFLAQDLSDECAAKGSFSLNREFGPG